MRIALLTLTMFLFFSCATKVENTAKKDKGLFDQLTDSVKKSFKDPAEIEADRIKEIDKLNPDVVKNLTEIEKKFEELDVDKFLASGNIAEIDGLKNDFYKYQNLAQQLDGARGTSRTMRTYISPNDTLTFINIRQPSEQESFGDGQTLSALRGSLSRSSEENLAKNVVLRKYKLLLFRVAPALDKIAEAKRIEREKNEMVTQALNEKERQRHDKVLASPNCEKVAKLNDYCVLKMGEAKVKKAYEYEKKLNMKSGTQNLSNIRAYTANLMEYQRRIAQLKKEFFSIKSSVISLDECNYIWNSEFQDNVYSPKLVTKLKAAFKNYCEVDWNENQ